MLTNSNGPNVKAIVHIDQSTYTSEAEIKERRKLELIKHDWVRFENELNRRIPNGTSGGMRGRKRKKVR